MSRGGRGGARGGGGGGLKANALPFAVDEELDAYAQRGNGDKTRKDVAKEIFPAFGQMIAAAPITDDERALLRIADDLNSKRRLGPFWTGSKEQWAQYEVKTGKKAAVMDPFTEAATYARKNRGRSWRPADLSRIKLQKRFFPKELHSMIEKEEMTTDADGRPVKRQKRLGLVKKTATDKLAKFDDKAEDPKAGSDGEDDAVVENQEEGEDFDREPGDDNFEEDEDDGVDDYNAEQYFDGGDEDNDDGGGGEDREETY